MGDALKREHTDTPPYKNIKNLADKLPEELRANYRINRRSPPLVECLKVVAGLKLWADRGYRDIQFEVPLALGRKTVFVKVLAMDGDRVVGVECASDINFRWLRRRMKLLRGCLPADSHLVAVFPSDVDEHVHEAIRLADEVWITGKDNSKVAQIIYTAIFGEKL